MINDHGSPRTEQGPLCEGPLRGTCKENGTSQGQEDRPWYVEDALPVTGLPLARKKNQGVNLYPTPRTEWKYLGMRGSGSKYLRNATMKLSTVRVVGNTL